MYYNKITLQQYLVCKDNSIIVLSFPSISQDNLAHSFFSGLMVTQYCTWHIERAITVIQSSRSRSRKYIFHRWPTLYDEGQNAISVWESTCKLFITVFIPMWFLQTFFIFLSQLLLCCYVRWYNSNISKASKGLMRYINNKDWRSHTWKCHVSVNTVSSTK